MAAHDTQHDTQQPGTQQHRGSPAQGPTQPLAGRHRCPSQTARPRRRQRCTHYPYHPPPNLCLHTTSMHRIRARDPFCVHSARSPCDPPRQRPCTRDCTPCRSTDPSHHHPYRRRSGQPSLLQRYDELHSRLAAWTRPPSGTHPPMLILWPCPAALPTSRGKCHCRHTPRPRRCEFTVNHDRASVNHDQEHGGDCRCALCSALAEERSARYRTC